MHHKATKQAKTTPVAYQKTTKPSQLSTQNHTKTKPKATKWAGFALKNSHSPPPLRQAISLSALALLVFELAPSPPKQKLNRTKRLALAT